MLIAAMGDCCGAVRRSAASTRAASLVLSELAVSWCLSWGCLRADPSLTSAGTAVSPGSAGVSAAVAGVSMSLKLSRVAMV